MDNKITQLDNKINQVSLLIEEKKRVVDSPSLYKDDGTVTTCGVSIPSPVDDVWQKMEERMTQMIQILDKMGKSCENSAKLINESILRREVEADPPKLVKEDVLGTVEDCKESTLQQQSNKTCSNMSILLPEIVAHKVFDNYSERVFSQKAPVSIPQGTNSIIYSPIPYWKVLKIDSDRIMVYNLHENEYGKIDGNFFDNFKNMVSTTQVFEVSAERVKSLLSFPLAIESIVLLAQSCEKDVEVYTPQQLARFDNIRVYKFHENEYGKVSREFCVNLENIVTATQLFPGLSFKDKVAWMIVLFVLVNRSGHEKLDVARSLVIVDGELMYCKLHEDECNKVLARSKEHELVLKLLNTSVRLDAVMKCSCYNAHLCKCRYLERMWCLFDDVSVDGNIWEQSDASKTMQFLHLDSWNCLTVGYKLYRQGDMELTWWRKMQHTTSSDKMKHSFEEVAESAFSSNYLLERYMKRRKFFSLLTYYIEGNNVGVCTTCSFACHKDYDHGDYDVVKLWTKRNSRCNRRKSKFQGLYPEADVTGQVENCEDWLIEEHFDFESPDENSRDKEHVFKPFTEKHCKVRSMEQGKNGGTFISFSIIYPLLQAKSVYCTLCCMADNKENRDVPAHGNEWEVVSLSASTYAASPGQHEQVNNDASDFVIEEGGISNTKDGENWEVKALSMSDEFTGVQLVDEKGKSLSMSGTEIEEGLAHHGLNLVDKEQSLYSTAKFTSVHGETSIGRSALVEENKAFAEPVDSSEEGLDLNISRSPKHMDEDKDDGSDLPCEAWWKRRGLSLYTQAKEVNVVWFIFIAAAVMGLVIIGQRWQVLQHKWPYGDKNWRLKSGFTSAQKNHYTKSLQLASPINVFRGKVIASKIHHPSNNDTTERSPVAISIVSTICCALWETILTGQILKCVVNLETSSSCDGLTFVKHVPVPQLHHCKKSRDRISDMSRKFLKLMNTIGALGAWTVQNQGKLMKGSLYLILGDKDYLKEGRMSRIGV